MNTQNCPNCSRTMTKTLRGWECAGKDGCGFGKNPETLNAALAHRLETDEYPGPAGQPEWRCSLAWAGITASRIEEIFYVRAATPAGAVAVAREYKLGSNMICDVAPASGNH